MSTKKKWARYSDPLQRFNEKIVKHENGCWLWQGKLHTAGYAQFRFNNTMVYGHRWAYETYKGPIPDGFTLDHLCGNRCCVNPDHLEPVTVKENNARKLPRSPKSPRTHCVHGHAFTDENSIMWTGGRRCRICYRERRARYRKQSMQIRQGIPAIIPDARPTRTFYVIVASDSDDVPLMQELETLKQMGLILNFSRDPLVLG